MISFQHQYMSIIGPAFGRQSILHEQRGVSGTGIVARQGGTEVIRIGRDKAIDKRPM